MWLFPCMYGDAIFIIHYCFLLQWVFLCLQFWQIYLRRILMIMQLVLCPLNHLSGAGTLMVILHYGLIHNNTSYNSGLTWINKTYQFSTEEENNSKLSFLDVEMQWENGLFITSIYRMKTHNDHYLNYKLNHVPRILSGVVKCLSSRATFSCYSALLDKELVHLKKSTFLFNGYNKSKLLVLPYIKSICETIEWICRPLSSK